MIYIYINGAIYLYHYYIKKYHYSEAGAKMLHQSAQRIKDSAEVTEVRCPSRAPSRHQNSGGNQKSLIYWDLCNGYIYA